MTLATEQCTLSIRLSTDGFSFSVSDPVAEGEPTFSEYETDESLSLTANLKQAFRELEWLKGEFRRVHVLMADKRFTLLPLELFDDEQAETVFYLNHPRRENEVVQYNIMQRSNAVVLFGMDKSAHDFLAAQYPSAKFHSQASPLIEFFTTKSRQGNSRKLYVHLRNEAMDVFGYERGQLLMANSYECRVTADRIYYLLYVWKQLGFEQERDELHLSGLLRDKESLLAELRKYLRQVFVMNPASNLDLQAITQCE